MKRPWMFLWLLCLMHSVALAEAIIIYEPVAGGFVGGDGRIELERGSAVSVMISLMNDGVVGFGGNAIRQISFSGFQFNLPKDVSVLNWQWLPEVINDRNEWFTTGLPDPQAVAFGDLLTFSKGKTVAVATVDLMIDRPVGTELDILFGDPIQIVDATKEFVPIRDGTERGKFRVVPEPATLGLLACAGLFGFGRFRRR